MKASRLWEENNKKNNFNSTIDWDQFKRSEFFYKIGMWDPNLNGVRYLKMLLYNLGSALTNGQLEMLSNISNRTLGHPFSVSINGVEIDFDYLCCGQH